MFLSFEYIDLVFCDYVYNIIKIKIYIVGTSIYFKCIKTNVFIYFSL